MTACETEFTKSKTMDLAGLCLRGFLLKYDNLSDFTSTYKIPVRLSETYDLKTELQNERIVALELIDNKLVSMREARRVFEEEKKRLAEEEATAVKKGANQAKSVKEKEKSKKMKRKKARNAQPQIEPPLKDEDTIVDVSDELLSVLKEHFLNTKEKIDPIYLDLETNEINLREMIVLGGTYSFNLLQRPRQTRILGEHFLITLSTKFFSIPSELKELTFCTIYS